MIHYWRPPMAHLLCGEDVDTAHTTDAVGLVTCQACRDIINERARGTVARTMRRKQLVQAQARIANDVLWRRGYPLPDGQPITPCEHMKFAASVEVDRLQDTDDGPVTHYAADIKIQCADCLLPFRFIGVPGGLHPAHPTTSLAGDELRAPLEPMPLDIAAALARLE